MIECIAVMIVLIILFILILPHFLNAQISRRVAIRTEELQAFTTLFRNKELQYLQENGPTPGAPDSPIKEKIAQTSAGGFLKSHINVELYRCFKGGPCITYHFQKQWDDYELEGINIVTTVNKFENSILWVIAAPVTSGDESWPQFKTLFKDTMLLQNYVNQRRTELGYYDAEFYREYYRPYTFDVSNGLGSDGAIMVIYSEPLAR
jgi:type II secretory pathway pseudopilin PulG